MNGELFLKKKRERLDPLSDRYEAEIRALTE